MVAYNCQKIWFNENFKQIWAAVMTNLQSDRYKKGSIKYG